MTASHPCHKFSFEDRPPPYIVSEQKVVLFKFPDVESHGRRMTLALFSHQKKTKSWPGQSSPAILLSSNSFDS